MEKSGVMWALNDGDYSALTNSKLLELLKERALDCGQKSMTARLAAVIDQVEVILTRGYDRSQVRDLLVEVGWRFTPDSFDSALSRVRRRRRPSADGNRGKHEIPPKRTDSGEKMAEVFANRRHIGKGAS
jgi:hypothetical protein